MSESPVTISVVIPLYCEEAHLREVLSAARSQLETLGESWEIVLVDDGSTDGTWGIIREQARKLPNLRALRLSRNFGKEAALCAGLDVAAGQAVIVMDGDMQHPPELIRRMVQRWRQTGADIVEGVKASHRRDSLVSRCGSRFFYRLMGRLSGFDLAGACDFKLINRRVVQAWLKLGERNLFFRGMIAWLGFSREQIPFDVPGRAGGQSRWSTVRLMKLAVTGLTAFSSMPLRAASLLGAAFFLFAVAFGIYALVMKLAGRALTGFTTVILLQLLIGSILMIVLGIIGEYVARVYEEVKGRPRYLVCDVIEPEKQPQDPTGE